jgi:hypothetical protein
MSPKRMTALVGIGTVAALTVGVWVAAVRLERGSASPRVTAVEGSVVVAATLPAPGSSGGPADRVKGDLPARPGDGPARQQALRPNPRPAAAPFVHRFAAQPGVRPLPPRSSPTAKVRVPATVDGCDRNYGEETQCIPLKFPPDATDKCDWLKTHGFEHVLVAHIDRQKLDHDHDGVACND